MPAPRPRLRVAASNPRTRSARGLLLAGCLYLACSSAPSSSDAGSDAATTGSDAAVACDDRDPCTADLVDAAGACSHLALPPGCCHPDLFVWPTTGSAQQTLISSTYGPRHQFSQGGRYDWHQGLDLPGHDGDIGFQDPVYAVGDGTLVRVGVLPGDGTGAVARFGAESGNVVVLEHDPDDTGLDHRLFSVYLHLAPIDLGAMRARIGGTLQTIDATEYFHLDGADTDGSNRGTPRETFKTSGLPVTELPRVQKGDEIARIGDTGSSIAYEHLHFEIRDCDAGMQRECASNPYGYLPYPDRVPTGVRVQRGPEPDSLRVTLTLPRDRVDRGEVITGDQELDVERLTVERVSGGTARAVRSLDLFADVNRPGAAVWDDGQLGFDHDDFLSDAYVPDQPDRSLEGVQVRFEPADFVSESDAWSLDVVFSGLEAAGFAAVEGETYRATALDVCGVAARASE
jgi:murein DD-endopeptidase MepM/ murein hydrolase activator NlpD